MTFIIGAYANGSSFHLSDRRLSIIEREDARPVYDLANKSIIVRTKDAVVAIGFTGIAHIDGQPTDNWLLERLVTDVELPGGGWSRGLGSRRLHQVVNQLRVDLAPAVARCGRGRQEGLLLRLLVTGQRWDRSNPRCFSPVSLSIDAVRQLGLTSVRVDSDAARTRWFSGEKAQLSGSVALPDTDRQWLVRQFMAERHATRAGFRSLLVETLRRVAERSGGTVGHDCTLTELRPYRRGITQVLVEHFHTSNVRPVVGDGTREHPLTFTPAVVTAGNFSRPAIQNCDQQIGNIELKVVATDDVHGLPWVMYREEITTPDVSTLVGRAPHIPATRWFDLHSGRLRESEQARRGPTAP